MGLSNEERRVKFHWAMTHMRHRLNMLALMLRNKHPRYVDTSHAINNSIDLVDGWIDSIDEIVGEYVMHFSNSGSYWLIGPNDDSYSNLWSDHYGVANIGGESINEIFHNPENWSLQWHRDNLDREFLADRLTRDEFKDWSRWQILAIAMFWDAFSDVDFMTYAVNRYQDELFGIIKTKLHVLIGSMSNQRYALISENRYESDYTDNRELEHAFLCKYRVLLALLDKASSDFTKREKKSKSRDFWKKQYRESFDMNALVDQVARMSLVEIESFFEAEDKKEWDRCTKRDDKDKPELIDAVCGPQVSSQKEIERIINTTTDPDEYNRATEIYAKAYNTYFSFRTWEDVLKIYPRAAKVGLEAAEHKTENKKKSRRKPRKKT